MFRFFLLSLRPCLLCVFFFFNDTATTEIYTLSLHDALPISCLMASRKVTCVPFTALPFGPAPFVLAMAISNGAGPKDRKSTRLNSSHQIISYAVFCLKKKKNNMKYNSI